MMNYRDAMDCINKAMVRLEGVLTYNVQAGRYRFTNPSGDRDISSRMSRTEAVLWLSGYMAAIDDADREAARSEEEDEAMAKALRHHEGPDR